MLHGTINEKGNCLGVREAISEKKEYFSHVSYKSLASGALILEIVAIADNEPMDFCFKCYK